MYAQMLHTESGVLMIYIYMCACCVVCVCVCVCVCSYLLSSYEDNISYLLVVPAALVVALEMVLQHIHWDLYMSNSIQQYNHICTDTCMSNILTHT